MLCFTLHDFPSTTVENKLVRFLAQDLIPLQVISGRLLKCRIFSYHALRPTVKAQESYMFPEKHKDAPAELVYIRSWSCAKQPAWLFCLAFIRNALVLEQHVIFESYSSKAREHGRAHEMMRVRPKPINDIYKACVRVITRDRRSRNSLA